MAYGVDGVCHQAANCFLYSACPTWGTPVTVTDPYHGVRGAIASVAAFGIYGVSELIFYGIYWGCCYTCTGLQRERPPKATPESSPTNYGEELGALLADHADRALRGETPNPFDQVRSEFGIVVKHVIGIEFVTDKLAELQMALLKEKDAINSSSVRGADFAHRINDAINGFLGQMATHLGKDKYRKLFDLDPDVPLILVRPDVAAITRR